VTVQKEVDAARQVLVFPKQLEASEPALEGERVAGPDVGQCAFDRGSAEARENLDRGRMGLGREKDIDGDGRGGDPFCRRTFEAEEANERGSIVRTERFLELPGEFRETPFVDLEQREARAAHGASVAKEPTRSGAKARAKTLAMTEGPKRRIASRP